MYRVTIITDHILYHRIFTLIKNDQYILEILFYCGIPAFLLKIIFLKEEQYFYYIPVHSVKLGAFRRTEKYSHFNLNINLGGI